MPGHACRRPRPWACAILLLSTAALLGGCRETLPSYDDVHVPAMVEERFPIRVVEQPVRLDLQAQAPQLRKSDYSTLVQFARQAEAQNATRITIAYPSGNRNARAVAGQAAGVLAAQGLPRGILQVTGYKGRSPLVVLSYDAKFAATKPCGDWSANLAADMYNEPAPDFGCANQNNLAAMLADPEDIRTMRRMSPVQAHTRSETITAYPPPVDQRQTNPDPVFDTQGSAGN